MRLWLWLRLCRLFITMFARWIRHSSKHNAWLAFRMLADVRFLYVLVLVHLLLLPSAKVTWWHVPVPHQGADLAATWPLSMGMGNGACMWYDGMSWYESWVMSHESNSMILRRSHDMSQYRSWEVAFTQNLLISAVFCKTDATGMMQYNMIWYQWMIWYDTNTIQQVLHNTPDQNNQVEFWSFGTCSVAIYIAPGAANMDRPTRDSAVTSWAADKTWWATWTSWPCATSLSTRPRLYTPRWALMSASCLIQGSSSNSMKS